MTGDGPARVLTLAAADPQSDDARALLAALSARLAEITGSSGEASFRVEDLLAPGAVFAVARDAAGAAVGCGALRPLAPGVAELKRMYARPGTRGVGAALLAWLEAAAPPLGHRRIRLETRAVNRRAVRFYTAHGYRRIANFGPYVGRPEALCFEKTLSAAGNFPTPLEVDADARYR
jgi:GNAT superfamily N-acetyltransferase